MYHLRLILVQVYILIYILEGAKIAMYVRTSNETLRTEYESGRKGF